MRRRRLLGQFLVNLVEVTVRLANLRLVPVALADFACRSLRAWLEAGGLFPKHLRPTKGKT